MQRLPSSDEDVYDMPQVDLAEAFGTPPTRNNSIKPLRKLTGKDPFFATWQKIEQSLLLLQRPCVEIYREKDKKGGKGRHASSEEQAGEPPAHCTY